MYVCVFLFQATRPIKSEKQTNVQTNRRTDRQKQIASTNSANYNTQMQNVSRCWQYALSLH